MTRRVRAHAGLPSYGGGVPAAAAPVRSGKFVPEPGAAAEPDGRAAAGRARRDRGMIGVVLYLIVLVCAVAGVYIAWRDGSAGGGRGGAVAGSALLVAAAFRLVLPSGLAGMLASRRRVTDVLVLTAFGASLLAVGLVLPRLGPLSAQGRMAGPPMKGKYG